MPDAEEFIEEELMRDFVESQTDEANDNNPENIIEKSDDFLNSTILNQTEDQDFYNENYIQNDQNYEHFADQNYLEEIEWNETSENIDDLDREQIENTDIHDFDQFYEYLSDTFEILNETIQEIDTSFLSTEYILDDNFVELNDNRVELFDSQTEKSTIENEEPYGIEKYILNLFNAAQKIEKQTTLEEASTKNINQYEKSSIADNSFDKLLQVENTFEQQIPQDMERITIFSSS